MCDLRLSVHCPKLYRVVVLSESRVTACVYVCLLLPGLADVNSTSANVSEPSTSCVKGKPPY